MTVNKLSEERGTCVKQRQRSNRFLLWSFKIVTIGLFTLLMGMFWFYTSQNKTEDKIPYRNKPSQVEGESHFLMDHEDEVEAFFQDESKLHVDAEVALPQSNNQDEDQDENQDEYQDKVVQDDGIQIIHDEASHEAVYLEEEQVGIDVYSKYIIDLTADDLVEASNYIKDGQFNVLKLVNTYLGNMSMLEKMKIVNLVLNKIQHIDIGTVWSMIADGITYEESMILAEMIEQHFTEEEIDLLYSYYQKTELASTDH